jgi:hypothetical protein
MEYVSISDAGSYWAWEYANVSLGDLAKLSAENCTFSNSERYGLYANNNATFPSFMNNTFSSNTLAGLNIAASHMGMIDGASNYNASNGENFINVRGMVLNTAATWPYQVIDYPSWYVSTLSHRNSINKTYVTLLIYHTYIL